MPTRIKLALSAAATELYENRSEGTGSARNPNAENVRLGLSWPGRPRLRGMQRVAAMRIELRVDRNGQTIFRAECDTERGSSFAEFSKLALREFNQQHPEVSLLDDDVWLKFGTVRCPEAPKTGSP